MVANNADILDHLPYSDIPITNEERTQVEDLIRLELSNNPNYRNTVPSPSSNRVSSQVVPSQLHPMVDELVAPEMPSPSSLTLQAIERYENEESEDGNGHIITGIDTSRYLGYEGDNHLRHHNDPRYYESLYYNVQEAANVSVITQNREDFSSLNNDYMKQMTQIQHQQEEKLEKKRKRVDEINGVRRKRQNDFQPVNDYLNGRWKEGVKSVVDLSVETLKREG